MHLEMQMRSHCAAGMPHIGNDLPGFDLLAHRDTDAGAVRVQSSQPAAVVQLDVVTGNCRPNCPARWRWSLCRRQPQGSACPLAPRCRYRCGS